MCISDSIYDCKTYLNYYPKNAQLMNDLEQKFISFLGEELYQILHVPSLISGSVLEKCGYFDTFPHHLSAVCSIKNNDYIKKNHDKISEENLKYHGYYLTPAACVHVYPMLGNNYNRKNTCYTFNEKVFRYEGGNYGDERLWEFAVREFVFVGRKEYVLKMLGKFKSLALEFSKKIDLNSELVSASDIFYPNSENKIREKLQLANDLKHELRIPYKDKNIAIASFNFHDTHFSKAFNFDDNNQIVTGCVGFGLDRWILCCNEQGIFNLKNID